MLKKGKKRHSKIWTTEEGEGPGLGQTGKVALATPLSPGRSRWLRSLLWGTVGSGLKYLCSRPTSATDQV